MSRPLSGHPRVIFVILATAAWLTATAASAQVQMVTITTSADSGSNAVPTPGSLRAAVAGSGMNGSVDVYDFDVTGVITLTGEALPSLNAGDDEILFLDGGDIEIAGTPVAFSGAGGLELRGFNTLTMSARNTYTGITRLTEGTLRMGVANGLSDQTEVSFINTGTLDLNGFDQTVGDLEGDGAVFLGSANLTFGELANESGFAGVISGTGSLTKVGAGRYYLAGSNTYSGPTLVGAGTLTLVSNTDLHPDALSDETAVTVLAGATLENQGFSDRIGSLAGAGQVLMSADGGRLAVGANGTSTTFTGNVQMNPENVFEKVGAGTMVWSGQATFSPGMATGLPEVQVTEGALVLDGSTDDVRVRVASGGTLYGSGTIQGASASQAGPDSTSLENLGRLSPGSPGAVGTMTVQGDYDQLNNTQGTQTGDYLVDLAGSASDRLVIQADAGSGAPGAAVLGGDVIVSTSTPASAARGRYTILEAAGGFRNVGTMMDPEGLTFAGVQAPRFLLASLNYDATHVYLDVQLDAQLLVEEAGSERASIAQALAADIQTAGTGSPFLTGVADPLLALSGDAFRRALDDLGPDVAGTEGAFRATGGLLNTALGQLDSLRGGMDAPGGSSGSSGEAAGAAAAAASRLGMPNLALGSAASDASMSVEDPGNDKVWALGFGTDGRLSSTAAARGSRFDGAGALVGRTWKKGDSGLWGVHGGFVGTDARTDGTSNQTDVDTVQIGMHGSHVEGKRYVDGLVGYSHSDFRGRRSIGFLGAEARNDHDGDEAVAYGELGYVLQLSDDPDSHWFIQPQLALQYRHYTEDAYTETGAGAANLVVGKQEVDSFQTALGARVFKTCRLESGGWLIPDLRVRWGHELGDIDRTTSASFVGTNAVFQTNGPRRDRDSLQLRTGVTAHTLRDLDIDLGYYGELSDGQETHSGVLRVIRSF